MRSDLVALREAVTDTDAPVVSLEGAGPAFCAGADLDLVAGLDRAGAHEFAELGQNVARAIETADPVVVAAVDGPARGGGVELALACDLRIATPAATFAETGVRLGLFGAWGGTVRLPQVVGKGVAADLTLSGRTVDAETALTWGLVSRVVESPRAVAHEVAAAPADTLARLGGLLTDGNADGDNRERQERQEAEAFAALVAAHGDTIGGRGDGARRSGDRAERE
jgi:enoyl-CoA hydratase/carnithine racemase